MTDTLLRIQNLTVLLEARGTLQAVLDRVSLTVTRGEPCALVGESGSGKTALVHTVLGLFDGVPGAVAGQAWVTGVHVFKGLERWIRWRPAEPGDLVKNLHRWNREVTRRLSPVLGRRVTLVPQDPSTSLPPHYPVGKLIERAVRRGHSDLPRRAARRAAAEWLERVGMYGVEAVMARHVHELSGGMAQRVALALALAPRPDLLVADEPTTGLDATLRLHILGLLRSAALQGTTVLLITHDIDAARLVSRRAAVLCRGRIVEHGPTESVLGTGGGVRHPYTRMLLEAERRLRQGVPPTGTDRHPAPADESTGGCPHAPACPDRTERCHHGPPPWAEPTPGHLIACWEATR